jgi:NADPH:quinone reductase-like Zn-dependent oxidoreductase
MKAVVQHRYGPADQVLAVEEIEKPTPKQNEVLVRVRAASMHADVWHVVEGVPLVSKPANLTFEQAAALPSAGLIALNNLGWADKMGQSVLINGGGGAMGTLAIQIAKAQGAHVTAVDSAEKLALMRAVGADRVIDYAKQSYLESGERYDRIVDVVGLRKPKEYRRVLTPNGRYIPIGHADYGRAPGRLGGRIVGSVPYFVGCC